MSKHAIVAAVAVALALIVPTSASAFTLKEVGFDVEVKGVQTVKWEQHQPAGSGCDVAFDGGGTRSGASRRPSRSA